MQRILLSALMGCYIAAMAMAQTNPPCQVVACIERLHCKRGPAACEQCRAIAGRAWFLLDTCPPNRGQVARRVLHVPHAGQDYYLEFDIIRKFDDEASARQYAQQQQLPLVNEE